MDPATMALISGGLSFGQDYLSSRSAKKQRKRYNKRLRRTVAGQESILGRSLGQQEALARQATQQQLGGYDTARREAARLGRGAKREALDRETQLMGRASQGLTQSGLGSTTVGTNLQRGITSDTNRTMAGVDEGLAGLYGNLALGRAGVEAQGSERLGELAGQRGDIMSSLLEKRLMGQQLGGEHNILQSLLTGAQTGMGMYSGMGGSGGEGQGGIDPEMLTYLFDLQQNGPGHYPIYSQSGGRRAPNAVGTSTPYNAPIYG